MKCKLCVRKVSSVLQSVDGESDVHVFLEDAFTTVQFTSDADARDALPSVITEQSKIHTAFFVDSPPAAKHSVPEQLCIRVDGMTCQSCVRKVRCVLHAVDGV